MNTSNLFGIFYGLMFSILWGIGNVCLKTQAGKLSPLGMNAIRSLFGCLFFLLLFIFTGGWSEFLAFSIKTWIALVLTVLIGNFFAESLFLASMKYAPISQVTPIYWTYPAITTLLAWIFLGEKLTWLTIVGIVLVVIGVSNLGINEGNNENQITKSKKGIFLAVACALAWGVGATVMKVGVVGGDPKAISAMLVVLNTIFLFFFPIQFPKTLSLIVKDSNFRINIAIAGMIGGSGFAALFYVLAVGSIGAGQAAVLGATSPLFSTLIAGFFLKETIPPKSILGSILIFIGVSLNVFNLGH
jgi:drug/metabolite transporter (DMT)-like permease